MPRGTGLGKLGARFSSGSTDLLSQRFHGITRHVFAQQQKLKVAENQAKMGEEFCNN